MEELILDVFAMTDVKVASQTFRNRFSWGTLPENLRNALCVPNASNGEVANSLLDEISTSNRLIHENNQNVIDGYNRGVFKYLQTVYAVESGESAPGDSEAKTQMNEAKTKALGKIQFPTISADQLHVLKVLCPQAAMKALSCLDNSFQGIQRGEAKIQSQRICRVYPVADMTASKSDALLSVFPDKLILKQAIMNLLSEGLYFMLAPSHSLSLPVFSVPSQTPKRAKHTDMHHSGDHYICLGGYYCTCDAFFNKVLTGPPLFFHGTQKSLNEGNRGEQVQGFGRGPQQHSHHRELYCKHSLASQLVLACESTQECAQFDVNCFISSCTEFFSESSGFYRIVPATSFYYDCVFLSEERYYNLFRRNP